ncbi:MAG: tetratricopeptide repeat protein [Anaerolineales bacterium]|nr:tetratricopeptide repeat protein [Anaerolineales bacterium]
MENSLEYIQSLINKDELEEAEIKARELLKENQESFECKIALAKVLAIKGKVDEAFDLLKEVIKQDSNNYYPLYLLGSIKENSGDFDEAITFYKKALDLKSDNGQINYRLGKIYNNDKYKGKNEYSSLYHFRNSILGDNPPVKAYLELASLEPTARAVHIIQNGINKFPLDKDLIITLCDKLYQMKEYETCIQNIDLAKNKDLNSFELQILKALAHYRLKQYDQAFNELEQISYLNLHQEVNLNTFKGILLLESQRYLDAETILKKAIANDITNSLGFDGHVILACCNLRQSKHEEANKVIEEIPLSINFESPFYFFIGYPYPIEIDQYFTEAINGVISYKINDARKARYFKAIYTYSSQKNQDRLSTTQLEEVKKEYVNSISLFDRESLYEIYDCLYSVSMDLKDWTDASYYYFLSQTYSGNEDIYVEIEPVLVQINKSQKNIEKLFNIVEKVISEVAIMKVVLLKNVFLN